MTMEMKVRCSNSFVSISQEFFVLTNHKIMHGLFPPKGTKMEKSPKEKKVSLMML